MPTGKRLTDAIERMISEGNQVINSRANPGDAGLVDPALLFKWIAGCRNLMRMLGRLSTPFSHPFLENSDALLVRRAQKMMSSLLALKDAAANDLLVDVSQLIFAEAFADLMDQATELHSKGYFVAAGVICRAVFEEHLRKLCDTHDCMPDGRPTIEHLKQALVRAEVLNKIDAKNADAIAGEGNHCAHNLQPLLDSVAVEGLIRKVEQFLVQHPLR